MAVDVASVSRLAEYDAAIVCRLGLPDGSLYQREKGCRKEQRDGLQYGKIIDLCPFDYVYL